MLSEGLEPKPYLLNFLACFHGMRSKIRNDSQFRDEMTELLKSLDWTSDEIDARARRRRMYPRHHLDTVIAEKRS